jgi:hypothetical protein
VRFSRAQAADRDQEHRLQGPAAGFHRQFLEAVQPGLDILEKSLR